MVSVHELAPLPLGSPGANVELLQKEGVETVRCPICKGLRGIQKRHLNRSGKICPDCKKGHVVPMTQFYNYWLERYSMDEIREMGRAIWG